MSADAAVLAGVGGYVPPTVVTNDDLAARHDTSDEWIRVRTGIRSRHVAGPGLATSDLAVEAGRAALKQAGTSEVDAVIVATATPDHPVPATAPMVAARLDLIGVPAFDLGAVCSGFLYGLACATSLITAGQAGRVLLIGADTFSTILHPDDRSTAAIFGDGAGAVVLRAGSADEPGAVLGVELGSDGRLADLIIAVAGGSRQPRTGGSPAPASDWLTMQGRAVFRHAVRQMAGTSRRLLDRVGWAPDQVDRLVAHQANVRILDAVTAELGLPGDRAYLNLDRVGNTAGASIPLALADAAAEGALRPGDRVLLSAFGAGATWGAAALSWPDL